MATDGLAKLGKNSMAKLRLAKVGKGFNPPSPEKKIDFATKSFPTTMTIDLPRKSRTTQGKNNIVRARRRFHKDTASGPLLDLQPAFLLGIAGIGFVSLPLGEWARIRVVSTTFVGAFFLVEISEVI